MILKGSTMRNRNADVRKKYDSRKFINDRIEEAKKENGVKVVRLKKNGQVGKNGFLKECNKANLVSTVAKTTDADDHYIIYLSKVQTKKQAA
jgi:hypothetical protein